MDARLVGPTNGPPAGVMGRTLVLAVPNAVIPAEAKRRAGTSVDFAAQGPGSADAVRDDSALVVDPTNTHNPAWKTTGGAP